MIFKKEVKSVKKNGEETYELKFNQEFWQDLKEKGKPINVVIDEAHTLLNPRKSMSKTNTIMTDFIALLRRILGEDSTGYGKLVLITQLRRRLDVISREMANQFRYFLCHYNKTCRRCGYTFGENNENPEPRYICPKCNGRRLDKHSHTIEVWHFDSENSYLAWKTMGMKSFYRHYYIHDIEKYFNYYDTLQWDNLISEY